MLFTHSSLSVPEERVVNRIRDLRESLKMYVQNNPRRWTGLLARITRAKALRATNSIEDINVSDEDAMAAVDGSDASDADKETWKAVQGYKSAMEYILQQSRRRSFNFSIDTILAIHFMITQHNMQANPGTYRPGWVGVRNTGSGEYVHEGVDRELLEGLMDTLVLYMNGPNDYSMIQAAMTHLNIAMLHPFSDGNGRTARCLQTAILAREGIVAPTFSSIEEYIGRNQQEYYDVLGEVGKGHWNPKNDSRPWVKFCLTAHYRQARTHLKRIEEVQKAYGMFTTMALDNGLNQRCALGLLEASMGMRVRRASYRVSADVHENTASRDLIAMSEAGLLIAKGEKRGRYYEASDEVKAVRASFRRPKDRYDPFDYNAPNAPVQEDLFA